MMIATVVVDKRVVSYKIAIVVVKEIIISLSSFIGIAVCASCVLLVIVLVDLASTPPTATVYAIDIIPSVMIWLSLMGPSRISHGGSVIAGLSLITRNWISNPHTHSTSRGWLP